MAKARKKNSTSVGIHGHMLLGLLYRYGALTHVQIERLSGLGPSAVDRQFRPLQKSGRVLQARDMNLWDSPGTGCPPSIYHLGMPAGARAGARALGLENDRWALQDYRRIRLPDTAVHRVQANEYLIRVLRAAPESVTVPFDELYSEACPDFPLFGSKTPKTDRKDSKWKTASIVPDGVFALDLLDARQHYYLELESELRKKHVLAKVRDYMGWWRRTIRPNAAEVQHHDSTHRLEPLIILSRTPRDHGNLHEHLRAAVPELDDYEDCRAAISEASGGAVSPLELILLAPYGSATLRPHNDIYKNLEPKSFVEPAPVSLRDAAENAGRISIPAKKDARARVKAEQEAAEEAEKKSKEISDKER